MSRPFSGLSEDEGPPDQVDYQGGVGQVLKEPSGDWKGDLEEVQGIPSGPIALSVMNALFTSNVASYKDNEEMLSVCACWLRL